MSCNHGSTQWSGKGKFIGQIWCQQEEVLLCAMQSLYEKDKIFALQYIAADGGSKIIYCSDASEGQQMKAACKRIARQFASNGIFGTA